MPRPAFRPAARLAAPMAVAVAAAVGCSELVTGPGGVSALDFTGIPFPAVVSGDTMRDSDGNAAPLRATAYDARGDAIVNAPIDYFSLDTGVTVDGNGYLVASRRDGTVRVLATVGGLQSQVRTVTVTRRPDTVSAPTSEVALEYRLPDASSNVSPALALSLRSADTVGGLSPNVTGWLVRWRIIHDGDTLAPTDTSLVALWSPSGSRHSLRDTTKADGTSTRRLRVYANLLPLQPDSFIVIAEVKHRGVQVVGSPLRYVVSITPPTL